MDLREIDDQNAPDPVLASKTGTAALLRALEEDAIFDGSVALALGSDYVLCHDLLDSFPLTAAQYIDSVYLKLVPQLAAFVHFTLSEMLGEAWLARAEDLRLSTDSASAFQALAKSSLPDAEEDEEDTTSDCDGFDLGRNLNVKRQAHAHKKRARVFAAVDPKPFEAAGYPVPRTRPQADETATNLLEDVKELLSNYLDVLQQPETVVKLVAAVEQAEGAASSASLTRKASTSPPEAPQAASPALPSVPPSLASTTVNHELRAQLSRGHFSPDNQKRLSKTASSIPIYEAKMTRDSRLVYRIDCVNDSKYPNTERQVIKVFGIYTHAQMDDRLRCVFDAVGKEAAKKGQAYRDRCIHRESPVHSGDNVIPPAIFVRSATSSGARPARDDGLSESQESQLLPEDVERVHTLLNLEKYMVFSRPVLNCIVADIDAMHVFNLSERELEIVDHIGSCYVLGRSGTGKTTTMLFKMWGRERTQTLDGQELPLRARQLFVTQSPVLVEKVEEAYTSLAMSLQAETSSREQLMAWTARRQTIARDRLVANDDWQEQGRSLPQHFDDLEDEHFPLFLTFDRLCRLLEGSSSNNMIAGRPSNNRRNGELVTYEHFLAAYWPHFSQNLIDRQDSALVFSEIMGVIKGSETAAALPGRCLDRETYEGLNPRGQLAFASCRSTMYDIYVQYTKQKVARGDYDAADRAHNVLRILREKGIRGRKIDYIYVDEVQDNMLINALVLRQITCNPNGLFWAGDTAQTISVGSTFRFSDLAAFLYRFERKQENISRNEPRTFQLTTNYRSHAGIMNCAQTVIELLTTYWSDTIDKLAPEEAEVAGAKPVFLTGWSEDNGRYEHFLFDSSTIQESKGLEFDDVLLFDFFHDSPVRASQWRVILNMMNADSGTKKVYAPAFSVNLHAGVCGELKCLYVALTRARKNVWIVDASDRAEPMRLLWTSRQQVLNCSFDGVPSLGTGSSLADWAETAAELFTVERYVQAKLCYERARLPVEAAIAEAYHLRQQAKLRPFSGSRDALPERHRAFVQAASAFVGCAATAVQGGHIDRGKAYYRAAANAYLDGDQKSKAAEALVKAGDVAEGAQLYREAGNFDETIAVVRAYRSQIPSKLVDKLIDVSRFFYFQAKEFDKATSLFKSTDAALEFLEDTPFSVEKATLLESAGKLREAAELYLDDRPHYAIRLLLKDVGNSASLERGRQYLLDGLWRAMAHGPRIQDNKATPHVAAYLQLLTEFIEREPDTSQSKELRMFHALAEGQTLELQSLANEFLQSGHHAAAFRCAQSIFHSDFPYLLDCQEKAIEELRLYREYIRQLHDFALDSAPCDNASFCRIFGLQRVGNGGLCVVPVGSFVHEIVDRAAEGVRFTTDGVTVPTPYLTKLLPGNLRSVLHKSLEKADRSCRYARVFRTVCLTFTLLGSCNRGDLCPRLHPKPSSLNAVWYNRQIYLHLLLISILDYDTDGPEDGRRLVNQRFWMNKLYEALFPPMAKLGSVVALSKVLVPEAQNHFQQVKYWCQNLLRADAAAQALRMVLRIANLSFAFDHRDAPRYLTDFPALQKLRQRPILMRDGQCVVDQLLSAMEGKDPRFIDKGVSFFRHVVDKRTSIDVSALCDFGEYMAGCLVLERSPTGFHNVTLPKSWIPALVDRYQPGKFSATNDTLLAFMDTLGTLLDVLYNGYERLKFLLFEGREIDSNVKRGPFIARVCRMLCAIGYNRSNRSDERDRREDAMSKILKVFQRRHDSSSVFSQYMRPRSWLDLKQAYEDSAEDQLMDEIIILKHEKPYTKAPPQVDTTTPRQVFFKTAGSIPAVLGHDFFVISSLRKDAPAFVPAALQPLGQAEGTSNAVTSPDDVEGAAEHEPVTDPEPAVAPYSKHRDPNVLRPPPTAAQKARAVRVIEAAYLHFTSLRSLSGLDRTRQNFVKVCVAQCPDISAFPSRRAKLLYFGALPHVLTCLDAIKGYLETAKMEIRQGFATLKHQRLEAMSDKLTDVNAALKRARAVLDALGPHAGAYTCQDCVERLGEHVKEVVALMECLDSEGQRGALAYDYEMAVCSVLEYEGREREKREKEARKRKEKPQLNMADDYYDEHGELEL
ncbi:hypothetical protein EV121DRAFT_286770 [Schizophyllum commune]